MVMLGYYNRKIPFGQPLIFPGAREAMRTNTGQKSFLPGARPVTFLRQKNATVFIRKPGQAIRTNPGQKSFLPGARPVTDTMDN